MTYTGVFVTKEEIEEIRHAANMPYIIIGGQPPESAQEACHRLALKHGLPEIPGFYGCDLRSGEIVTA